MNAAHLRLLLNHLPLAGLAVAVVILVAPLSVTAKTP
jgi:hypothetical protein